VFRGVQIFAFAAVFGFAAAFVFNPELGMARDWDLLATMLLPLVLLSGYAMAVVDPDAVVSGRIAAAGLASFFIIALPFLLMNHQTDASVKRYQDLLSAHSERSGYGWEVLAGLLREHGNLEDRLTCWENAAAASPNPRYFENAAKTARLLKRPEKARSALRKLDKTEPSSFNQAHDFFLLFLEFGFIEHSERMLPFIEKLAPPGTNLNLYSEALEKAKSDTTYTIE